MKKIVSVFAGLLYIDLLFIIIGFQNITFTAFITTIFTNLGISILLSFIKKEKIFKRVAIIIIFIFALYAFIQLEFKNFMSTFYSVKAIENGIGGVKGYIWYFISSSKYYYYFEFLGILIFLIIYTFFNFDLDNFIKQQYKNKYKKEYKKKYNNLSKKIKNNSLVIKILIATNIIFLAILSPLTCRQADVVVAYSYNDNYDLILNNVGSNHFFFKDLYSFAFPKKFNFTIETNDFVEENKPKNITEEENEEKIDDTKWISLKDKEENETIKTVDGYLLSLNQNHANKNTGEFEDYNFIYFLVESLDYMAIDENLTPTLYKMWNESFHFTNHYSPIYACCTGDSEFVSMTGIYPYRSVCTAYEVLDTNLETSLAGLFKQKGYNTHAFHNWDDQFYKRNQLEYAYGIDEYKDINKLDIKRISGWQSDADLIEAALPDFIDDEKFFTFFITSSMHWPYDSSSTLGDKYLDEINKYHKDYPIEVKRYLSKCMEFDRGMEYLLNALDEAGKLNKTVISIFPDHRPLKFEDNIFEKYTILQDRKGNHKASLTPFFIYNYKTKGKEIENVCSTIDQLPTIANLFNLNYDPRLYMGNDALNDECIVVFNNLDWITNKGYYTSGKASKGLEEDYVKQINSHIKNVTNISKAILDYDYFEKRKEIIYPTYK